MLGAACAMQNNLPTASQMSWETRQRGLGLETWAEGTGQSGCPEPRCYRQRDSRPPCRSPQAVLPVRVVPASLAHPSLASICSRMLCQPTWCGQSCHQGGPVSTLPLVWVKSSQTASAKPGTLEAGRSTPLKCPGHF